MKSLIPVLLLAMACANEPYPPVLLQPLTIKKADGTKTFTYRQNRLVAFTDTNPARAIKLYYSGSVLTRVISDSTADRYTLTTLQFQNNRLVSDSSFLVTSGVRELRSIRNFTYSSAGDLTTIGTSAIPAEWQLLWQGGNITEVIYRAQGLPADTTRLQYDKKKSLYPNLTSFLYTLPANEWFWLSPANPILIVQTGRTDRKIQYGYNKFDYPNNINDNGVKLTADYRLLP